MSRPRRVALLATVAVGAHLVAGCTADSPTQPAGDANGARITALPGTVGDLAGEPVDSTTVALTWTQVDDGTDEPAQYEVRYALSPIGWGWGQATIVTSGSCAAPIQGTEIGKPLTCTVPGLVSGTLFDFQLVSFRRGSTKWREYGGLSNVATVETPPATPALPGRVEDLTATAATDSSVTLSWTIVGDGAGAVAEHEIRFALTPIGWGWGQATVVDAGECASSPAPGAIGETASCTVSALAQATSYDFQMVPFRSTAEGRIYADLSNVATGQTTATPVTAGADPVTDLAITGATESSLAVLWTQVGDGTGEPADYRVKYAVPSIDYASATAACDVEGSGIGSSASCAIEGLSPGTEYDVQLMSYRLVDGHWAGAVHSNVATAATARAADTTPPVISGVAASSVTTGGADIEWTTDEAATGRVEYGTSTDYGSASATESAAATAHRATLSGLEPGTTYHFRVTATDASGNEVTSGDATFTTESAPPPPPPAGDEGIWISPAEIAALPMAGSAWNNVQSAADAPCGTPDISNQDDNTNVCILAKALVYVRTGQTGYRTEVLAAIGTIATSGTYVGRALALGRELGAYVLAADLIDLPSIDPTLDGLFRAKLRELRTTYTSGAADDLIDCHEKRPNNWGAHCGATRAAIAVYLGDTSDLARAAQVFKGYLGDRSSYAGFVYGGPDDDLSWQCDPSRPVGINPAGCTRDGHPIDGVLPDDQRRGGSYTWPPPRENYVWEALQGLLAQAVILYRAGYPVWDWEDRALLRAVRWLHDVASFPAMGDDEWQPHIVNHYYGTGFPTEVPARHGKNVGWTDWTHR